jgi:hypothetical protein
MGPAAELLSSFKRGAGGPEPKPMPRCMKTKRRQHEPISFFCDKRIRSIKFGKNPDKGMKIKINSIAVKTSNWRLNLHRLAKVELPEWLIKAGTNRMASILL